MENNNAPTDEYQLAQSINDDDGLIPCNFILHLSAYKRQIYEGVHFNRTNEFKTNAYWLLKRSLVN